MSRVLVLGGYGVFGKRIVKRLSAIQGIELIIAGRNIQKCNEFLQELKFSKCILSALQFDAKDIDKSDLFQQNIFVIINACGLYDEQNYSVAQYCIEHKIHYIDLADNRAFVYGISNLQKVALNANVLVVSGASTVPALSSAVMDHFKSEFGQMHEIDYGVTPGNQTDRGLGTVAAILSYVGKPFKTRIHAQDRTVYGWQSLHKEQYPVLGSRWMSNCNIPDLDLFKTRYPDLKTIRFYAGLELGVLHLGLWFLSWLSRWKLLKNPEKYAGVLRKISLWFFPFGSDKGGMHVKIRGIDLRGNSIKKIWFLIADQSDGPYIPAIPSILIVRKLLDGSLQTRGAMPCIGLFTLDEFKSEVSDLKITFHTDEPLYRRILSERYGILPNAVQKLHDYKDEITYTGKCDVVRGAHPFCRFVAWILSLPPEGAGHDLKVYFKQDGLAEHWTRYFGKKSFYSRQWEKGGVLYERINITTLAFDFKVTKQDLNLVLRQVYVLGLPVAWLFKPKVIARESEADGKFQVNVEVHLPFFGLLVKYDGWLKV